MHQQIAPDTEVVAERKARKERNAKAKAARVAKANTSLVGNGYLGGFTRGNQANVGTPPKDALMRGTSAVPALPVAAAVTPKVVPFFPPVFHLPTWEVEIAKPENMFMITHLGKVCEANKMTTTDLLKNLTYPVVYFAASVYAELQYLFKHIPSEWAVILMYRRVGKGNKKVAPHFLVYGYFFVDQEVTSAEVELDQPDFTRYIEYLQANHPAEFGEDIHNKLGHLHSHNNMGAFWSGVDKKQQDSPGQMAFHGDFRIFCVGNNKGELLTNYVLYANNYLPFEDVATGLYFGDGYTGKLTKERKAELEVQITALVKRKTYGYVAATGTGRPVYAQDFAARFDDDEAAEFLGGFYGGGMARAAYEASKPKVGLNSVNTSPPAHKTSATGKVSSQRFKKVLMDLPGSVVTTSTDTAVTNGVSAIDVFGYVFNTADYSCMGGDGITLSPMVREDVCEELIDLVQEQLEDPELIGLARSIAPEELISVALETVTENYFGTLMLELTDFFATEVKGLLRGTEYTFPEQPAEYKEAVSKLIEDRFELSNKEDEEFMLALWEYLHVFFVHKTESERLTCVANLEESITEVLAYILYGVDPGKDSTVKLTDAFTYLSVCRGEKTMEAATTRYQVNTVLFASESSINSLHTFESHLETPAQ